MQTSASEPPSPHSLSVVVPVYRGERSLPALTSELTRYTSEFTTPQGRSAIVSELIFVFDHGPDGSARVIRELAAKHDFVRPIWLSRNFGQHSATLAGMASSGGDWIVTLDEDGQYDPADMGVLLDAAMAANAPLVYANPTNRAPHGALRNLASRGSKRVIDLLTGSEQARRYHSYRLILGEVGRSVAAYAGSGVYLDVALGWVVGEVTTAPVILREEGERVSGYTMRKLLSHFWRLVLTSGTRGLRLVSLLGSLLAFAGLGMAVWYSVQRLVVGNFPEGWASLMVVVLVASGLVLFGLGVVAEYIGVAVNMAMGRPLYLITSDPKAGPLGRALPKASSE